jgi:hypothetical protein
LKSTPTVHSLPCSTSVNSRGGDRSRLVGVEPAPERGRPRHVLLDAVLVDELVGVVIGDRLVGRHPSLGAHLLRHSSEVMPVLSA